MADTMTGHASARHRGDESEAPGPAADVGLWAAVFSLAAAWAGTPVVRRFAPNLPRNAAQRASGVPGRLQEMEAGGAGISARPLRLTQTVRLMSRMPPSPISQGPPDTREWAQWLAVAAAAETAHRAMIAWLRSRMPRYPDLPAPHLAPGAPLRADESGYELLWTRDEPLAGLQFQNPPPRIAQLLQAGPNEQRQIVNGTQALGAALEGTEEWQRMGAAADSLTGPARAQLRQAKKTLQQRLGPAEIGRYSQQAHARSEYRGTVLDEVLAALSGPAEEYARSFDAANRLLETAASDVFSQLATYGRPTTAGRPGDIDLRRGARGLLVSFTRPADDGNGTRFHLEMGQLVWLDDALVRDCVQITSSEFSFGLVAGERERCTGTVLPGTGEAWPR